MIKTFFYLKTDKENNDGESPIYAKIKLAGNTTTLRTGKFISKERWDFTNKLRNKLRLVSEKNCRTSINLLKDKIDSTYLELVKANPKVTLDEIKSKINGKPQLSKEVDIIKLFKLHNEYFKKKHEAGERSKATLQKYNRTKDLLSKFIKVKYGKTIFTLSEIDNQFVYNLESYLKYESIFKSQIGLSHNVVVKYFQCLKTICKYGIKRNLITTNPFSIYDEKIITKDAVFLTKAELERIENKEFSTERLDRVKDIFLFSCYTSYAPIDVKNLTYQNLIKDGNDSTWIMTNRTKTNVKSNVPVLPPVQRIIDKYAGWEGDNLLPMISNQKINESLHVLK